MIKYPIGEVLENGPKIEPLFSGDAFQIAVEKKWLKEFSKGQFVYTEEITRLFRAFQELFRREIVEKLGFKEWMLPRILPREALEKFGSIEYAPNTLFQAQPFIKNPSIQSYFLDPVQSASLYYTLAKEPLKASELPIKVFEIIGGYQWRCEAIWELHGFDKLLEYLKLEHVYVGYPTQVIEARKRQKEEYVKLFNKIGFLYRIVVGAPCHSSPPNTKRYEKAKVIDEIPLFDFEFYIPKEKKWLEVCGTCIEEDENTRAYGIKTESEKEVWSGCSGVGLNRLVYSFLSQFGFEKENYPKIILEYLK
jgi:seryl-tRNA synthetase